MYARIVTGQAQPGRSGEFLSAFQEMVSPELSQEQGFKGVYLLAEPQADKFVAVALWETEADARASETGYARQRLPKVAHLLVGRPTSETYEVVLQA